MGGVTCIQIAAHMPPHVGGVGDYAMQMARAMRQQFGIETIFLACSVHETDDRVVEGFAVHVFKSYDAQAVARKLAQIAVSGPVRLVYHLSGYGYSPDGAPAWLVEGLRHYLRTNPAARLATIFHELYATSMPWRRSFWHSPRQRRVAKALAHISDHGLCTIERNQRVLQRWAPELPLIRLAVPSNIAAPQVQVPWSERPQRMAIFGLPGSRMRAYRDPKHLQRLCAALGVTEIWDIGPGLARYPTLPSVRITPCGAIAESEVSARLMKCRYGYLDYTAVTLAKSGVMAAYCAHGLVPVIPTAGSQPNDGLELQRHYLAVDQLGPLDAAALGAMAMRAQQWYATHDIQVHASWCYARLTG